MHRRAFLQSVGVGAGAVLLGACGDSSPAQPAAQPSAPSSPGVSAAVSKVAPDADPSLTLVSASFEQLVGDGQPFAFGLVDAGNQPLKNVDAELFVVSPSGAVQGPFSTTYQDVEGVSLGLYLAEVDLKDVGDTAFVAVTSDNKAGSANVPVVTPKNSQAPAPGMEAISVATATTKNDQGVAKLCTLTPQCGMHELSLADALDAGRPVMLTFATPAYCQTAVCGPSVQVVEQVRKSGNYGQTVWIHVEVYRDEGQTLAKPVEQWALPSEPWLFAIGSDGKIAARADGPLLVLPDQVDAMAKRLS